MYFPVGSSIAEGVTSQIASQAAEGQKSVLDGRLFVALHSAGSVENLRAIATGEIEAGLVQADTAFLVYSQSPDTVPVGHGVRAIASLYPERLHIIVRRDAGIRSVKDLKGKTVSLDEAGSGTLAVMRTLFAAYGMRENEVDPLYLKPEFVIDRFRDGKVDGFCMVAGVPLAVVDQVLGAGIDLVPVDGKQAAAIAADNPSLVPGSIPAGVYDDLPATPTLAVYALLVVNESMDAETAYAFTKALWSPATAERLAVGHPQGREIALATALTGISIPLHDGALRFYQEQGMKTP